MFTGCARDARRSVHAWRTLAARSSVVAGHTHRPGEASGAHHSRHACVGWHVSVCDTYLFFENVHELTYVCVYIHTHTYACTQAYIYIYIYIYSHIYTYIRMLLHTLWGHCTYTHTHTHTHEHTCIYIP
jgi:hypothetical protein